jgi:hypothetical protein
MREPENERKMERDAGVAGGGIFLTFFFSRFFF